MRYSEISEIGYWYNPRTQESYLIDWYNYDNIHSFSDHADVVMQNPDWFGFQPDDIVLHDIDTTKSATVMKGWVRLGYTVDSGLILDARNALEAAKATRWFVSRHKTPISITIDIVSLSTYCITRSSDIDEYIERGRLEPAWKRITH
jgi:hypothetical protein